MSLSTGFGSLHCRLLNWCCSVLRCVRQGQLLTLLSRCSDIYIDFPIILYLFRAVILHVDKCRKQTELFCPNRLENITIWSIYSNLRLVMRVALWICCSRDSQARFSQAVLQPVIPHQGTNCCYLPTLGDSAHMNWSVIALGSCLFHPDKSDVRDHMQNMLPVLDAALQAWLDAKLILVSRLSPWHKILPIET